MADQFYSPPLQLPEECNELEKNYLNCLFQKSLGDRSTLSFCNLEKVVMYHIECPDYVKKFDNPKTSHYLKRQLFNMLILPYLNVRMVQLYNKKYNPKIPEDFTNKDNFMPYPEEVKIEKVPNPEYLENFIKDADFTPDNAI